MTAQMLIDGEWTESSGGRTFETVDPATGEVLAPRARGHSGRCRIRRRRGCQGF